MPTLLDIETAGNTGLTGLLPHITAPGNYKKADSIAKWLEENGETARQEQTEKMALDPLLFRLRAIGLAGTTGEPQVTTINNEADEKAALQALWLHLADSRNYPIVGYNVLAFDLPRLLWRSMVLGAPPMRPLDLRKYGGRDALDLMLALKNYDTRATSLIGMGFKPVCGLLGIENPLPGVDGSMVARVNNPRLKTGGLR